MGKKIDRIFFGALGAASFFLLYLGAFGSIALACALSFCSCALVRKLLSGLSARFKLSPPAKKRALRARISVLLEDWARLPQTEAEFAMRPILEALYSEIAEADTRLIPVARPACCEALDAAACFALWQAHRDASRLVIACTGRADPSAFALVRTLDSPQARLLDGPLLAAALERRPDLVPDAAPDPTPAARRFRLRRLIRRETVPRCLLTGLSLTLGYLLFGHPLYLLSGLTLLLLAGLGLKRQRLPQRLF